MVTGIIGKKLGMSQVFGADGVVTPVTILKAGPCVVVQAKTAQTDGYAAVQLGLVEQRPAKVNKPTAGHYRKAGVPPTRVRREVQLAPGGSVAVGETVLVSVFADGDVVDVIGTSKGKGFQGVVRRTTSGVARRRTARCSIGRRGRSAPRPTRRASRRACAGTGTWATSASPRAT